MSLMNINTQRFGAGPTESRLYSQVACLRDETDYLGSLLIAEASLITSGGVTKRVKSTQAS